MTLKWLGIIRYNYVNFVGERSLCYRAGCDLEKSASKPVGDEMKVDL